LQHAIWIDVAGEGATSPGMRFSDLIQAWRPRQDERLPQVARLLHNQDAINIQFTSGTTGHPKGATLTHRNILNNGFFMGEAMKLTEARPAVHPRAAVPLLRHGAGQPGAA
jgi:fatty-acyl-CoA synthase